jgi:hypothetical protein
MWPRLLAETVPPGASLSEWTSDAGSYVKVEAASHGQFLWRDQYQRPLLLLLGVATLVLLSVCANPSRCFRGKCCVYWESVRAWA